MQSYPFSRHYTRKTKFFLKKHKTFSSVSPDFNKFEQQRYTQFFFSSKFCPTFFYFSHTPSLFHQPSAFSLPHSSFALAIPFPSTTQAQTAWMSLGSTWVVLGNPLPGACMRFSMQDAAYNVQRTHRVTYRFPYSHMLLIQI